MQSLKLGCGKYERNFICVIGWNVFEGKQLFILQNMQPWYWFSGLIGVGIVMFIVEGIKLLGPTFAISVVLIAQLGFALLWDSLGWLGLEQIPFTFSKMLGVLVIACGILVFKMSGRRVKQRMYTK
jgi:bacterial/archaeal transporter family-2 protein